MPKQPKKLFITNLLPLLLIFIILGFLAYSNITGLIVSDNSYISPVSDNNYVSPTSDDNYQSPASDNNYVSPVSDENYQGPQSDNMYTSPVSDNKYILPASDKNYKSPISDNNFQVPGSDNSYTPPSSDDSYETPKYDAFQSPKIGQGYINVKTNESFKTPDVGSGLVAVVSDGFLKTNKENLTEINQTTGVLEQNVTENITKKLIEFNLSVNSHPIHGRLGYIYSDGPEIIHKSIQCSSDICTHWLNEGDEISLIAKPRFGIFEKWENCNSNTDTCKITISKDLPLIRAHFAVGPEHTLQINKIGEGFVSGDAGILGKFIDCGEIVSWWGVEKNATKCSNTFPNNSYLWIKQQTNNERGWWFNGFKKEQCDIVSYNQCYLKMNKSRSVDVLFTKEPSISLNVSVIGSGKGYVYADAIPWGAWKTVIHCGDREHACGGPPARSCILGSICQTGFTKMTNVSFRDSAAPGSKFVEWTGPCNIVERSFWDEKWQECNFVADKRIDIIARFEKE